MKAPRPVTTLSEDALVDRVAARVLSRLAGALGAAVQPEVFTTRRGGPVPPEFVGRSKAWRKVAPTIPGSARIGRWVTVPRESYARWVASKGAAPASPAPTAPTTNDRWDPRAALLRSGLRLTNETKRGTGT